MEYLSQFLIILGFSLAGECLQRWIPLPIPASVYGLVLLFAALCLKIVKLDQIRRAGSFLISILPVLFVSPVVGILENWGLILVLLFAALCLKIVKLDQIRRAGSFLISILPVLFVSPVVGILENWGLIRGALVPVFLLVAASTVLTFGISGRVTQWWQRRKEGKGHD